MLTTEVFVFLNSDNDSFRLATVERYYFKNLLLKNKGRNREEIPFQKSNIRNRTAWESTEVKVANPQTVH